MSDQLDLELWTKRHHRRDDGDTSRDAARAARGLAGRQHALILAAMADGLPRAAERIGEAIGLNTHQIGKRLGELVEAGRLEPTEMRHRNKSGRMAVVYRVKA